MPDMDNRTRRALDGALRTLLEHKPLGQIRVREVTGLCGLRRQSFYYHFKDVYELFDWSVERERDAVLLRREECLTWEQALRDLLEHIEEDQTYYRAILDNRGRAGLRRAVGLSEMLERSFVYYRDRCGLTVDAETEEMHLQYAEAVLLSLLESWMCGKLEIEAEQMLRMLSKTVEQGVTGATLQTLREWDASGGIEPDTND